jgi:hypothetical protein
MEYPKWLPYPKAWGQAIALCFELFAVVFIAQIFIPKNPDYYFSPTTGRYHVDPATGILSIFALLFVIYGLSMIHQILWDDPVEGFPVWFPRWRCWGEGLWGIFIFLVSGAVGISITTHEEILGILIMIGVAYCFHFRNLIQKKYSPKPKPEPKINSVEQDLNGIKGNLGIKKMNDVNERN